MQLLQPSQRLLQRPEQACQRCFTWPWHSLHDRDYMHYLPEFDHFLCLLLVWNQFKTKTKLNLIFVRQLLPYESASRSQAQSHPSLEPGDRMGSVPMSGTTTQPNLLPSRVKPDWWGSPWMGPFCATESDLAYLYGFSQMQSQTK